MFNVLGEWETPYGGSGNFFTGVLFNLFNPQPQTTLLELKDRHGWQVVSLGSGFSPAFAKPGSAQSGSSFSPPAPPCVSSFFIFYICSSLRIIFFYILYFLLRAYYLFLYFIFSPQKPGLLHGSGVPETIVDRLLKKGLEGVHCHLVRVLPKISFQMSTHIHICASISKYIFYLNVHPCFVFHPKQQKATLDTAESRLQLFQNKLIFLTSSPEQPA